MFKSNFGRYLFSITMIICFSTLLLASLIIDYCKFAILQIAKEQVGPPPVDSPKLQTVIHDRHWFIANDGLNKDYPVYFIHHPNCPCKGE